MKLAAITCGIVAAVMAIPARACGPGMTTAPSGGGNSTHPGRQRWVRHRMKQLDQQMHDHREANKWSDGLGYATGEFVPQMHRNAAEERRYMINRFEYLALKTERGKASAKDRAEMRWLQGELLSSH